MREILKTIYLYLTKTQEEYEEIKFNESIEHIDGQENNLQLVVDYIADLFDEVSLKNCIKENEKFVLNLNVVKQINGLVKIGLFASNIYFINALGGILFSNDSIINIIFENINYDEFIAELNRNGFMVSLEKTRLSRLKNSDEVRVVKNPFIKENTQNSLKRVLK